MRLFLSILAAIVCFAGPALAGETEKPGFAPMFQEVAGYWQIPENWTVAIAKTESNLKSWALNIEGASFFYETRQEALDAAREALEADKSFDCGLMQVNSFWLKKYNIPLEAIFDPLANIYMGGFILKEEIKRHGLNAKAIGAYHSPNPDRARAYANMVLSLLEHEPEAAIEPPLMPVPVYKSTEPMLVISPNVDTVKEWSFKVFSVKKQIERNKGVID